MWLYTRWWEGWGLQPTPVPASASSRPMLIINQLLVCQHPDTWLASENEEISQRSAGTASGVGLDLILLGLLPGLDTHTQHTYPPAPLHMRTTLPGPGQGTSWGLMGPQLPIYK